MTWTALTYEGHGPNEHGGNSDMHALVMGLAGAIPAATANDQAAFYVVVPFNMTIQRIKVTAKTAPSSNTTFQIRRSTDDGDTFSNAYGTVQLLSGDHLAENDPGDLDIDEGDVLNFSITAGGGSGEDVAVFVVAKAR